MSQDANTFLWKFGDSQTSTLPNPVHTYTTAGTYQVMLNATNECGTESSTQVLTLTSGTIEQTGLSGINILPNPNTGNFSLQIDNARRETDATISLFAPTGRLLLASKKQVIPTGRLVIDFQKESLPAGVYPLVIQTTQGSATLNVIVAY